MSMGEVGRCLVQVQKSLFGCYDSVLSTISGMWEVVPAGTMYITGATNKKYYSEAFTSDLTPKRHQTNTVEVCVAVRISIGLLCTVA